MKKLIIFGLGEMAQLAHFYFTNDSEYEVVAFTVDSEYIKQVEFFELPVIPYDKLTEYYPVSTYEIFIAIGYTKLNEVRKEKYLSAKKLGYKIASYISSRSTVSSNCKIGENCFIFDSNSIQPFVTIGNNVFICGGNIIGHHNIIKDHCFISGHVVIGGNVEVNEQCFIGLNATIRNNIIIGEKCIIGAAAVIKNNTLKEGIYMCKATERSKLKSTKLRKI